MGANEWRSYDRWPIETTTSVLHLAPGALDEQRPAESTSIPYVYDPVDPVPSTYSADYQDAPIDQGVNDGRHDVVRFLTPPLERPVEIIGSASVVLYAATDAPDTDWHVKLIDVAPDGTAINVATGMIRARYRDGFESPRLLERDEIVEYTIRLRATANRFLAGHRIRLDVTSSDFPNFDRNHNEGGDDNRSSTFRVAHQRIFVGGEYPSRLELPHPIGD
jgi:putative CocE/NonD family hydrolase